MCSTFALLTSYNYDALLSDRGRHLTVQCKNVPRCIKKFSEGYLVGSKALALFCSQFSLNFDCLNSTQVLAQNSDYDIVFKNSGNDNDRRKKLELLGYHLNLNPLVVKIVEGDLKFDLIFLYRNPEDIFLYFDYNFLCLFVDIDREIFVLSTQFLEFLENKIVKCKPSNVIGYASNRGQARILKYLNLNINYTLIFENSDGSFDRYSAKQKFKQLVYKVIILFRIYQRVVNVRKFNRVIIELESYFYVPVLKPVFKVIAGSKFEEIRQHYKQIQF